MKTIILKEKLKEGINVVERVSAKSLNLPILNNVLITAEKNFFKLTATDLEIGINWWTLVKTEREGEIAIPSRILSGFVNFLPNNLKSADLSRAIKKTFENRKTEIPRSFRAFAEDLNLTSLKSAWPSVKNLSGKIAFEDLWAQFLKILDQLDKELE